MRKIVRGVALVCVAVLFSASSSLANSGKISIDESFSGVLTPLSTEEGKFFCLIEGEEGTVVKLRERRDNLKAVPVPSNKILRKYRRAYRRCLRTNSARAACSTEEAALKQIKENIAQCKGKKGGKTEPSVSPSSAPPEESATPERTPEQSSTPEPSTTQTPTPTPTPRPTVTPTPPQPPTSLAQPVWLDGVPETYPFQKVGQSYDPVSYFTLFDESSALIATNSSQFQAHVNAAKADSSIDAIYLDPAGGTYSYPRNLLSGITRPADNPLVIRTLPGASAQAVLTQAQEDNFFQGVAFVDLNFSNKLVLHGGGQDVLVERCVGHFDLQGKRLNGVPDLPLTNLIFRLNVVADAWTMSASALVHGLFAYNISGFLIEGNIFDHNGWDPNGTRATPTDQGGATTRNHNIYLARPGTAQVARFNYIARGSSHGIHFRNGGHLHNNMFVRNPINWQYGYGGDGNFGKYGLSDPGLVEKNVTLDSDEINTSNNDYRGFNGWVTNVVGLTVDDNIAIDNTTTAVNDAFINLESNYQIGATVSNNLTVNWPGNLLTRGGSAPVDVTQVNNNFNATGLTGAAQALADQLKSDSYIASLKTTRVRLGVDIEQLKADMAAIRAGIIP